MRQDFPRAARLLGAAEGLREQVGAFMLLPERMEYDRNLEQLRGSFDPATLESEWAAGRTMSMDEAIEMALGNGGD
jgi:hypothetical protein